MNLANLASSFGHGVSMILSSNTPTFLTHTCWDNIPSTVKQQPTRTHTRTHTHTVCGHFSRYPTFNSTCIRPRRSRQLSETDDNDIVIGTNGYSITDKDGETVYSHDHKLYWNHSSYSYDSSWDYDRWCYDD